MSYQIVQTARYILSGFNTLYIIWIIVTIIFAVLKWNFFKNHNTPLTYDEIVRLAKRGRSRKNSWEDKASDLIDKTGISPYMDYKLQRRYHRVKSICLSWGTLIIVILAVSYVAGVVKM